MWYIFSTFSGIPKLYLESLVFHAKNSTDSPDEERRRLVIKLIICQLPPTDATFNQHFYLTWLENKQDAFLSAIFVGIAKRPHAAATVCLSAGCFVRKVGRFRNIVDWVVIIEFGQGLVHTTFRDVLAACYSPVKVGLDCVVCGSVA